MPVASLRWPDKDPADVLDYTLDLRPFLEAVTPEDDIFSVTWIVPAGLTLNSQTQGVGLATVWLSGGTAGTDYTVTARVVTDAGRTIERNVNLYVREL